MANKMSSYLFFLCDIEISKRWFCGLFKRKINLVITSDFKIIKFKTNSNTLEKKFPYKKFDTMDLDVLKKHIEEEKLELKFFTKHKKLNFILRFYFDNV